MMVTFLSFELYATISDWPSVFTVLPQDFQKPPPSQASSAENPVLRYLKTIVAWYEAALSITSNLSFPSIAAHLIHLPAPVIDKVEERIASFIADLPDTANHLDAAKLEREVAGATHHAEAILMALAHSFSPHTLEQQSQRDLDLNDDEWKTLKEVFCVRFHSVFSKCAHRALRWVIDCMYHSSSLSEHRTGAYRRQ